MTRRALLLILAVMIGLIAVPAVLAVTAQQVTGSGVGGVKIGKTYKQLREQHLIGKIKKGCELAPNTRSAKLRPPLVGSVNFTRSSPRKVSDIIINGDGAVARGVQIGHRLDKIRESYPKAVIDHSTEKTFELTLVKIPKSDGGKIQFGVSTKSQKVTIIGIPFIAFCE